MYEYVAFNPYNSSPEALATELTKKSADGWEVVNIVPTFDGRYCAFLRRPTNSSTATSGVTSYSAAPATTAATPTSAATPAAWYPDPSSALSCATGMELSGQSMLLAAVSNLPINQWLKTT